MRKLSVLLLAVFSFSAAAHAQSNNSKPFCQTHPSLCTELLNPYDYEGNYTGHDEPAVLFYSEKSGSGNSSVYFITLPKDPPVLPDQSGTAGTFNFQLHPAFWFGMAMCDTEGFPNFTKVCEPDSDENIFDDPSSFLFDMDRPSSRHGIHGNAILPTGLGTVARRETVATHCSGALH